MGSAHRAAGLLKAGLATLAIGGFGYIVKQAADFEKQMNMLEAVSHATTSQMKQMSAEAKALGADMKIPGASAADAARAMTELAKGGLSVKDAMAAARGTLLLAAAAQIDAGEAAKITATALNAFGLSGREATRVADLLAAAANASSGEISDFALGIQQAGASARLLGIPIQDLTVSLMEMANAGVRGSDAGTSLKTMFMRLADPSLFPKINAELKALGINIYNIDTGKFVGMRDLVDQVSTATQHATLAQKNHIAAVLGGSDAIRGINNVLFAGIKAWDENKKKAEEHGAALHLGEAAMKGYKGALEGLKNVVETLAIAFGEKLLPPMTEVINRFSKWLQGELSDPQKMRQWGDALHEVGDILVQVAKTLKDLLVVANQFAQAVGGWKNVIEAVAVGFAAWKVAGLLTYLADLQKAIRGVAAAQTVSDLAGVAGGIGGVGRNATTAEGQVRSLLKSLSLLRLATPIGIAVGIYIFKDEINDWLDQHGLTWARLDSSHGLTGLTHKIGASVDMWITPKVQGTPLEWLGGKDSLDTYGKAAGTTLGAALVLGIKGQLAGLAGGLDKAIAGSGTAGGVPAAGTATPGRQASVAAAATSFANRTFQTQGTPGLARLDTLITKAAGVNANPAVNYPGHSGGPTGSNPGGVSYHYSGEALDITGTPGQLQEAWDYLYPLRNNLAELFWKGEAYKWGKKIGAVPGHNDHIHVAFTGTTDQLASIVAQAQGKSAGPSAFGLPAQKAQVASQLFEMAKKKGLSDNRALEFVAAAYAESGLDPTNVNTKSGAAGLFQLLSPGYRAKAKQLGGLFDVSANAGAILPDYVAYWKAHPNAAAGAAGAAVEKSGEGPGFYAAPLSKLGYAPAGGGGGGGGGGDSSPRMGSGEYQTYKANVTLKKGEHLEYVPGKGYHAVSNTPPQVDTGASPALDVKLANTAATKSKTDDLKPLEQYVAELTKKIKSGQWKGHDLADLIRARSDVQSQVDDILSGKKKAGGKRIDYQTQFDPTRDRAEHDADVAKYAQALAAKAVAAAKAAKAQIQATLKLKPEAATFKADLTSYLGMGLFEEDEGADIKSKLDKFASLFEQGIHGKLGTKGVEAMKGLFSDLKKAAADGGAEVKAALKEQWQAIADAKDSLGATLQRATDFLNPKTLGLSTITDALPQIQAVMSQLDPSHFVKEADRKALEGRLTSLTATVDGGLGALIDKVNTAKADVGKAWTEFGDHVADVFDQTVLTPLRTKFDALDAAFDEKRFKKTVAKAKDAMADATKVDPKLKALVEQRISLWKNYYAAIGDDNTDLAGKIQDQIIDTEDQIQTRLDELKGAVSDAKSALSDSKAQDAAATKVTKAQEALANAQATLAAKQTALNTAQANGVEDLTKYTAAVSAAQLKVDDATVALSKAQAAVQTLGDTAVDISVGADLQGAAQEVSDASDAFATASDTVVTGIQADGKKIEDAAKKKWGDLADSEKIAVRQEIADVQTEYETGSITLPEALEKVKGILLAHGMSPDDADKLLADPISQGLKTAVAAMTTAVGELTTAISALTTFLQTAAGPIGSAAAAAAGALLGPWAGAADAMDQIAARIAGAIGTATGDVTGFVQANPEVAALLAQEAAYPGSGLGEYSQYLTGSQIPKMAKGGIVTKPTLALIGENGPEMVVPLDSYSAGAGYGLPGSNTGPGGNNNVAITVENHFPAELSWLEDKVTTIVRRADNVEHVNRALGRQGRLYVLEGRS